MQYRQLKTAIRAYQLNSSSVFLTSGSAPLSGTMEYSSQIFRDRSRHGSSKKLHNITLLSGR